MERILGIDLGTTNSCVAIIEGSAPVVIPNKGGYKTTPSMVAVTEAGKRLVGHIAKRQAVTNAENTVFAAKRLIGRKFTSPQVKATIESSAYRIVPGPHGDARIQLRDQVFSVPEISAMLLQELKAFAEEYLGESVTKAVITVPAYFNDNQRQATKDAGQIAGLEVIRIINEPTAAALAYGFGRKFDKTVAVFDLGGGTFDISVLEIGAGSVFKVVATAGDTFLGGEDFDRRIIDWLVSGFEQEHGVDLRTDRMALQRLKDAAEKAKCELSVLVQTDINLPFIISGMRSEALHLQKTLTRKMLDELCEDLVERCVEICKKTLVDAQLGPHDIDDVLLVGGMTRMPRIATRVQELFGKPPNKGVHPDEVVAVGAAVQGAALLDDSKKMLLLDVTPHSLGIMTHGGAFEVLIPQNTTVPTSRKQVFTTSRDNQTTVQIHVLQGDSKNAEDNELLGEFNLTGLRDAAKGQVEIEVIFEINSDGIVCVRAEDRETGTAQSIRVIASSGLTQDEMKAMIGSAKSFMVEKKVSDEQERVSQDLERTLNDLEALVRDAGQIVGASEFGAEALVKAKDLLHKGRAVLERRGSIEELKPLVEASQRALRMFKGVLGAGA